MYLEFRSFSRTGAPDQKKAGFRKEFRQWMKPEADSHGCVLIRWREIVNAPIHWRTGGSGPPAAVQLNEGVSTHAETMKVGPKKSIAYSRIEEGVRTDYRRA